MTEPASFWSPTAIVSAVKRTLLAMALLLTSVFGATGCGSDDGEAPVESRIKNSINCPSSSAKLGPNDSFDTLSKGWCSTHMPGAFEDFDYDYDENLRRDPHIVKEKFKGVDELMFEHKSGETIYDSPYDDINGG